MVEVLSANVEEADDLGRLAGWRLWRLINSRKNAHGYGPRRDVPQAEHVHRWDEASDTELIRRRAAAEQAQAAIEARRRADDARIELAAAERAALSARWDLRRWAQEPEDLHARQLQEHEQVQPAPDRAQTAESHAAAVARARAEKRARRRGEAT